MQTQEVLKKKIRSATEMFSVVKTMKTMAAVNIRQYELAVASLGDFFKTLEMGLQAVLKYRWKSRPLQRDGRKQATGLIVFGSDQGMCGQFNELAIGLASLTAAEQKDHGRDVFFWTIGDRVAVQIEQGLDRKFELPGSVKGITAIVQDMVLALDDWMKEKHLGKIYCVYNKPISASLYRAHVMQLLPLDAQWFQQYGEKSWPSRAIPLYTLPWQDLFRALFGQYLFVALFRAFAESLASENISRLASMQAAEKNIEELIERLNAEFNQQRQNAITEELLDIISGFEALTVSAEK